MRQRGYLGNRYCAILSAVGYILTLAAVVMVVPLFLVFFFPEEMTTAGAFVLPACLMASIGLVLRYFLRSRSDVTLSLQEGGIIVLLSWMLVIMFSAWPFMAGAGLPFSRAIFESVSGWTTTGLSVMDVTRTSPMVLLWRSTIQLAGGAGLAIIMMSAIIGPTGVGIASAEGRNDQLVPQVRQSARLVLMMYGGYALVGMVAYRIAGMSLFDAVNHAFTAVSTGGFSTHPASVGHWDSVAIESVTLPLMLLGNFSFISAWFFWRGKFKTVIRNRELRLLVMVIPVSAAAIFILTSYEVYPQLGKAIRVAIFETVSAATTTGFSTVSYGNWNSFGIFLLILLMLIGGGTCSTAGGIKQLRIYLLGKSVIWEVRRWLIPRRVVLEHVIWEGNRRAFVTDPKIRQVAVFVFLYMVIFVLGSIILCGCGFSLEDSLFEFASALGTVGLSTGITDAQMPDVALWVMTLAMFLGRLEFLVVIVSLIKIGRDGWRMIFHGRNGG